MNPKIQKLKDEKSKNNEKIDKLKQRNSVIDDEVEKLENIEIVGMVRAINIDIRGDNRLKKQYGKYSRVATLSTVAWVIPHEFQGMRTDTTVALSSTERLRSLLSYPLSE